MAEHEKASSARREAELAVAARRPASAEMQLAEAEVSELRERLAAVEAESERRRSDAATQKAKAQNLAGQVDKPSDRCPAEKDRPPATEPSAWPACICSDDSCAY